MTAAILDRIGSRLRVGDGCWEWTGRHDRDGYGIVDLPRPNPNRTRRVHRVVYELLVGPIPEGLEPDHTCRNRGCARPAHLDLVTHRENITRGNTEAARNAHATRCVHGHEFTRENTYIRPDGDRDCRACRRRRSADLRARRK